jgi:hypothetical protein
VYMHEITPGARGGTAGCNKRSGLQVTYRWHVLGMGRSDETVARTMMHAAAEVFVWIIADICQRCGEPYPATHCGFGMGWRSLSSAEASFVHAAPLQTNGVSIYHHQHQDEATGIGGEYMVSAVSGHFCTPYKVQTDVTLWHCQR